MLLPFAASPGVFSFLDQQRPRALCVPVISCSWWLANPVSDGGFLSCLPGSFPSFCPWTVTVALLGVGAKNLTPRLASPPRSTALFTNHLYFIVYAPSLDLIVWSRDSAVSRLISVSDYGYSYVRDGGWWPLGRTIIANVTPIPGGQNEDSTLSRTTTCIIYTTTQSLLR